MTQSVAFRLLTKLFPFDCFVRYSGKVRVYLRDKLDQQLAYKASALSLNHDHTTVHISPATILDATGAHHAA